MPSVSRVDDFQKLLFSADAERKCVPPWLEDSEPLKANNWGRADTGAVPPLRGHRVSFHPCACQGLKLSAAGAARSTLPIPVLDGMCCSQEAADGVHGVHLHASQATSPLPSSLVLSKPFMGQGSWWIFIMVKLFIYKEILLQMDKSPKS